MKRCKKKLYPLITYIHHKVKISVKNFLLVAGINIEIIKNDEQVDQFFKMINPVSTIFGLKRIGGDGDGGYLLPNDLDGIAACFSPGVAFSSSFELQMAEMGIPCHMADYSVDGPSLHHKLFTFDKKFLGALDSGNFIRLDTWINLYRQGEGDLLLQMDIEGGEYDVILSTPLEILEKFRIIIIEFHYLESLITVAGGKLISLAFTKLLEKFEIVHIHPNNCRNPIYYKNYIIPPIMEFTFLRKDRVKFSKEEFIVPNSLDRACDPSRKDFSLPNCWYKKINNSIK